MQDELFQRQWNAQHDAFAAGLKPAATACDTASPPTQAPIGRTYDEPVVGEDPLIQTGARILAAGAATVLLWVTVIVFTTTMGMPLVA